MMEGLRAACVCACAGPGVLVGTILTAALVKYTFPYDWSWVESLLFGAMFSATDPVAVIAVLKEVRLLILSFLLNPLLLFPTRYGRCVSRGHTADEGYSMLGSSLIKNAGRCLMHNG